MYVALRGRRWGQEVDRAVCPLASRPGRRARYTCVIPCEGGEHFVCLGGGGVVVSVSGVGAVMAQCPS